jgi:hypothetical protein
VAGCQVAPKEPLGKYVGLGFLHPLQVHGRVGAHTCACVPADDRDRVHVFFVNGLDPLGVGNFNGLCRYVQGLGFRHTYFGQLYHAATFTEEVRRLHRADPAARFVLFGYSAGANRVRRMAHELQADGVTIDLLVYLAGDTVKNEPRSRPANVRQLLNIRGHGLVFLGGDLYFNRDDIDGARNVRLAARHMLMPSRRETIETFLTHLRAVAARPDDATPPAPEAAPLVRLLPPEAAPE